MCEVDVDVVTDLQVVDGVLQAKVPCNLPKKTTGRNVRKPEGSARFDPLSEEWRQIWVDQENERKEKEDKKKELERKRAEREEMKRGKELEKKKREDKRREKADQQQPPPPPQPTSPPRETLGEPSPSGQASIPMDTEGKKDQNNDTNVKRRSTEQSQDQGLRRSKRRK